MVNESLASKLLNAELMAKLEEQDNRKDMVDASLLAKEEELEHLELALKVCAIDKSAVASCTPGMVGTRTRRAYDH